MKRAILTLLALWAAPAGAYNGEIHEDFYDLAFPDGIELEGPIVPPSPTGLADYRAFVYELASAELAFRSRWPRREDFDADAFKQFLELNPLRTVVGIDRVPPERGRDPRSILRKASVDPDDDQRNQDRLHLLPDGTVALDALGRAVPEDPRTVWFGGLFGPASQFDAHGATRRKGSKGRWMFTTLGRPQDFSRPPVPLGSAPEFSESYAQLAMLARLWGGEGATWLALSFAGNSLHGIEDLGNQIHTTQIGTHRFYLDTLSAWASNAWDSLSLWSLVAWAEDPTPFVAPEPLTAAEVADARKLLPKDMKPHVRFALGLEPQANPGPETLANRILGSHHRLLEAYVQHQYVESRDAGRARDLERVDPAVTTLIARAKAGDPEFREQARRDIFKIL